MIEEGLVTEVKNLYNQGIRSKAIETGIGYKELYPYFRYLKEYDKTSFPDVMYLDELFEKNSYKKI